MRVTGGWQLASGSGRTQIAIRSVVVELWTLSAEDLLASGDVGLVPWATLAQTTETPEALPRRCRERIAQAPAQEQANLAAVAQVMAALRYNNPTLLTVLGGRRAMIESPVLIELLDDTRREELHQMTLRILGRRFGQVPEALAAQVQAVRHLDRVRALCDHAAVCPDLDAFRTLLTA